MVKQEVLGLEVAMHDAHAVDVLDAHQQLLELYAGLRFFEFTVLDNVLEELSFGAVLHDQKVFFVCLDDLRSQPNGGAYIKQLYNVRMTDFGQDLYLAIDAHLIGLFDDLLLLKNLDGDLLFSEQVSAQHHFAKGPLALGLVLYALLRDGLLTDLVVYQLISFFERGVGACS